MTGSTPERFSLAGKRTLVTGAAGILGQHFVEALAQAGSDLAIVDLSQEKCDALAARLAESHKIKAIGIACDVSNPDSVMHMVEETVSRLGGIDILHNNAATKTNDVREFFKAFEDFSPEIWREIMSVNVDGMFLVAQAVGKQMIKQGRGGSIIQTASIYGVVAPDHRIYEGSLYMGEKIGSPAVYSASKAAVLGLTKYLAAYWAKHKIRVNSLTPGGVESGQNQTFTEKYSARVPLGRMCKADELVGALIYLASDAASYVTGQNIIVDGGLSVW